MLTASECKPFSRTAALQLAERLERDRDGGPDIRSPDELRLIVLALRYYGK